MEPSCSALSIVRSPPGPPSANRRSRPSSIHLAAVSQYPGEDILRLGDIFLYPVDGFDERTYYMGTVDGSTPYGNIIGAGPVSTTSAIKVAADPNRRSLTMKDWMSEFCNTSSNPVGHGFTQTNIDNDFASYSFEPKSNIPIKIIMLDDTQSEEDRLVCLYGAK